MTIEYVEKSAILQAYRHFRSNQTATASALGISVKTLYNKLNQYGLKGLSDESTNAQQNTQVGKIDAFGRLTGPFAVDNPDRLGDDGLTKSPDRSGGNGSDPNADSSGVSGAGSNGSGGSEPAVVGGKEGEKQGAQENGHSLSVHAQAGVGVEPPVEVPKERTMPVQERQEVQAVLPRQNAGGSSKRR